MQSRIAAFMESASAAIVGPAASRLYEHNPRLADNGAFPREAGANRDLIVIVRWTPAGGDPRRDAMDASDQRWLRLSGLRSRPEGQRKNTDRGKAPPVRRPHRPAS